MEETDPGGKEGGCGGGQESHSRVGGALVMSFEKI